EQEVLLRALAKEPAERFASCTELVQALAQAVQMPPGALPYHRARVTLPATRDFVSPAGSSRDSSSTHRSDPFPADQPVDPLAADASPRVDTQSEQLRQLTITSASADWDAAPAPAPAPGKAPWIAWVSAAFTTLCVAALLGLCAALGLHFF